METKVCSKSTCPHNGNPQPLENFHKEKRGKNGLRGECKDCRNAHTRGSSARKQSRKLWNDKNKRERSIYMKVKKYAISPSLAADFRDGKISCEICGRNPAVPDHCHEADTYRGALCKYCNWLEGYIRLLGLSSPTEVEEYCKKLSEYLQHGLILKKALCFENMIERALFIANFGHSGQVDKQGQPYILHPIRVMLSGKTEEEQVVGLLHDVLEDTIVTKENLLTYKYSEEIVRSVVALTHTKWQSNLEYYTQVKENPLALAVKKYDIDDNYSRLEEVVDLATRQRLKDKYERARKVLFGDGNE